MTEPSEGAGTAGNHVEARLKYPMVRSGPFNMSLDTWVREINHTYHRTVGFLFATGKGLLAAKAELGHGQWLTMFQPGKLKFSLRTAETLMAIAKYEGFADRLEHVKLPTALSTLYTLCQLPPDLTKEHLRAGVINPNLTLRAARHLVEQARAKETPAKARKEDASFDLGWQSERLANYLQLQEKRWPPAYRDQLAALLERIAAELRAGATHPTEAAV